MPKCQFRTSRVAAVEAPLQMMKNAFNVLSQWVLRMILNKWNGEGHVATSLVRQPGRGDFCLLSSPKMANTDCQEDDKHS